MILAFTVYGAAVPQGSMRAFIPKGWTRPILTSDNPALKSWRQLVAEAAGRELGSVRHGDVTLLTEPIRLTIAFYLPRPKSISRKVTAHTKKPDLDKLVRSCKDAMTKVIWQDDSQVVELVAAKAYAAADSAPHVNIRIEPTAGVEPVRVPAAPLPLFAGVR